METIQLKKKQERRLLKGHQWVFSNELVDVPGHIEPGDVVRLVAFGGQHLGIGFYNPHSLISFRFLTHTDVAIGPEFFLERIQTACSLRYVLYPPHKTNTFRVVHSESDFLPGLIIDKFNDILSVQTFSAGMERHLDTIVETLKQLFSPRMIVLRNESQLRKQEGLACYQRIAFGTKETALTQVHSYGLTFEIDALHGQKTGFFLDQRENRMRVSRYAKDAKMLDIFSNDGGFALHAARGGATEIDVIDSSESALLRCDNNFKLNNLISSVSIQSDAFEALNKLQGKQDKYDLIVLDPPSLTKSKKTLPNAIQAYKKLNKLSLALLRNGGFFATSSCSHHVTEEAFYGFIFRAAYEQKCRLRLLEKGFQAPDHPVLISMPETQYLKFAIFQLC